MTLSFQILTKILCTSVISLTHTHTHTHTHNQHHTKKKTTNYFKNIFYPQLKHPIIRWTQNSSSGSSTLVFHLFKICNSFTESDHGFIDYKAFCTMFFVITMVRTSRRDFRASRRCWGGGYNNMRWNTDSSTGLRDPTHPTRRTN